MRTILMIFVLAISLSGCSLKRAITGEVVKKKLVCVDQLGCQTALAKDCPKGGKLHRVVPAVVVEYSCNP
jgi:hypothetical protein